MARRKKIVEKPVDIQQDEEPIIETREELKESTDEYITDTNGVKYRVVQDKFGGMQIVGLA